MGAVFSETKVSGAPRQFEEAGHLDRLDEDVLKKFKAIAPDWQSRINEALKRARGSDGTSSHQLNVRGAPRNSAWPRSLLIETSADTLRNGVGALACGGVEYPDQARFLDHEYAAAASGTGATNRGWLKPAPTHVTANSSGPVSVTVHGEVERIAGRSVADADPYR